MTDGFGVARTGGTSGARRRVASADTGPGTATGPDEGRSSAVARPAARPRRRAHSRLRVLLAAVVLLAFLAAGGFGLLWVSTPSVADAPARAQAILAAHDAPGDEGVIPAKVARALLATEDSRFYQDPALDPRGVVRAAWGLVSGNGSEGGATIEVQLAKLLYTGGRSGARALVEQVGLAFKLDHRFSKDQILAMYLDAAYFGDGAYGITAAAAHYFALRPSQLSWAQASLLAGLVQAPTAYDPHGHLHAALERRAHVLDRLVSTGALTPARMQQVERAPLDPAVPFGG